MKEISLREIKQAMADPAFRVSLPPILRSDIQKYESNPSCACNLDVYRNVLKFAQKQLTEYYPGQEVINQDAELMRLAENNWVVLNCGIDELERALKILPPGRKQLTLARYEDQITAVINELDLNSTAGEVMNNHWLVVNCAVENLEATLKKLPPGRKQVAIARYLRDVTLVVNELNVIF